MTNPKNKVIGIVGGGQLGRMTILEARKMDIKVIVLTPEHPSPASDIADEYIIGSLYDEKKITISKTSSNLIFWCCSFR